MGPVANNLRRLARTCDWLVLWLDCDREGEAIAYEVIQIAREANPRLDVYRANFSALTHADLTRACLNLARPNPHLAAAVDARQEIDLRIGKRNEVLGSNLRGFAPIANVYGGRRPFPQRPLVTHFTSSFDIADDGSATTKRSNGCTASASFTRYLTLRYKRKLPLLEGILSYGPCQFPTLGFVVQRWLRQRNFIREPFWTISCTICVPVRAAGDDAARPLIKSDPEDGPTVEVKLHWGRNRLFDHLVTTILYDRCLQHVREFGGGIVTQVSHNPKSRWRPLPLSTVEFAKLASSKLRIDSRQAMRIAEEL
ncbi:isopentenyl-diphosphate delta-isomerase idi1, partial [Perkinsus olseni]